MSWEARIVHQKSALEKKVVRGAVLGFDTTLPLGKSFVGAPCQGALRYWAEKALIRRAVFFCCMAKRMAISLRPDVLS